MTLIFKKKHKDKANNEEELIKFIKAYDKSLKIQEFISINQIDVK